MCPGLEREEPHIRWAGKGRRRRPVTDVDYERLRERRYRDLVKASRFLCCASCEAEE